MALLCPLLAFSATTNLYYVNSSNAGYAPPYMTWGTAATSIHAAVAQAEADLGTGTNCLVWVTNGLYVVTTQINLTKAVWVVSVNGPGVTIVKGGYPASTNRCFNITAVNAILDGFTITNGYTGTALDGGGISMTASSLVQNCVMDGCVGRYGGALYLTAGNVLACVIRNNSSGQGGAALMTGGQLRACTLTGNRCLTSWQNGGAMRLDGGVIESCVVSSNLAGNSGGGIYVQGAGATIRNSLFYDNAAMAGRGGGLVLYGNSTVQNCTLAANYANWGGGLSQENGTVRNTIVYDNTALFADSRNLYHTSGLFTNGCVDTPRSNAVTAEPQFASLANRDFRLLPGSACIDSGSAVGAPTNDLDGAPRPRDGDNSGAAGYDLGAYEADWATNGPLRCNLIGAPLAAFNTLTASLTGHVAGAGTNGLGFQWDFGDGSGSAWSAAPAATHAYPTCGLYTVTLSVTNSGGTLTNLLRPAYVQVIPSNVFVSPAGAHTWPFDTWPRAATNLQHAVDAAGEVGATGSVVIVGDGAYGLTGTVAIAKGITVRGLNGPEAAVLDGQDAVRGLDMAHSRCVVEGLTISNGYAAGTAPANRGAGVYLQAGTLRDCTVVTNVAAGEGGGVYVRDYGRLTGCRILLNVGSGAGGGVRLDGGRVDACFISGNAMGGGSMGCGLSIGAGVASNCVISGNRGTYRGGGVNLSAGALLTHSIVANNLCGDGGGLYFDSSRVENCLIISNTATGNGGGLVLRHASLRNCLVTANAAANGGGVQMPLNYNNSRLESCTLVGNSASADGGGVSAQANSGSGSNVVVWDNRLGAATDNNIRGAVTNFFFTCSPDVPHGVSGNLTNSPRFRQPGSGYGTSHVPGDYHLRHDSPCLEAGTNVDWMASGADFAGAPRLNPDRPVVDIGAYEYYPSPVGTVMRFR